MEKRIVLTILDKAINEARSDTNITASPNTKEENAETVEFYFDKYITLYKKGVTND